MASHNQHAQNDMGLLMALLLLPVAVLALPALIFGMGIQRVLGVRPWSFPLWCVCAGVGALLTYALYMHGLDRLLTIQFTAYVQEIKAHQANIDQLWSRTWPVWLRTLVLTPVIAFWVELGAQMHGGRTTSLARLDRQRQQRITRSKRQAAGRVRRPERLPDAFKGQMVIGVTIDDDYAE